MVVSHLRAFWRNIFKRENANEDLNEEVRVYLEMTAAEKVRCGMAPEEALREARRVPVLAALTLNHADDHALAVDVADL